MKKLITICLAVTMILVLSGAAQATTALISSGSWTQAPPEGGIGSSVIASGLLDDGGNFNLYATKLTAAIDSTLAGYTYETAYNLNSFLLTMSEGPISLDLPSFTLTNYNNNVNGLPSEFLFVGDGFTTDARPVHFEAYWNADSDPLQYYGATAVTSVGADITSGFVRIVPEPATICILGLGALSLIRRKK